MRIAIIIDHENGNPAVIAYEWPNVDPSSFDFDVSTEIPTQELSLAHYAQPVRIMPTGPQSDEVKLAFTARTSQDGRLRTVRVPTAEEAT